MRVPGILFLALALSSLTLGQARFVGKVVEVIDGRTVIIETNAGRITAQLQYIETPEPEQPLHDVVRDHLASLALGKVVEFRPLRIQGNITVGRAELGGIDLGLQLVRNGAAWHEPVEISGQPSREAGEYASNQLLAKAEKRGVWSVADLKPPWQIRAEKQAQLDRIEEERRASKPMVAGVTKFQTISRPGMTVQGNWNPSRTSQLDAWGDVFAGVGKETRGLQTYTDPGGRFDTIYTSGAFVNLNSGKVQRRVECRLLSVMVNRPNGRRETVYVVGFQSVADEYYFSNRKSFLTFTADRKNLSLGSPLHGLRGETAIGAREMFFYRLTKGHLRSIGNAKNLELRIDGMLGTISEDTRDLFKQLAETAN